MRVTIVPPTGRTEKSSHDNNNNNGYKKLRDKFKRGDVLVMTPQNSFRGKDVPPREGLVMDVGQDYLTLGVGTSWPVGVMEMRKHDSYRVRLDRSLSNVPLRAQRLSLDKLRKGKAGSVANLLVKLFYNNDSSVLDVAREIPSHFDDHNLDEQITTAMEDAMSQTTFEPNPSQQKAVIWALKRNLALIKGPPGTGKTRVGALLISTALKMELKQTKGKDNEEEDDDKNHTPRILAVTHSNGAADVLLQALLQMNVPAVRAGRPASVSPLVQHRTIAALSERMPEVVRLRQLAGNATLDSETRQTAVYEAKRYMNDVQSIIAKSAPVVVASCIGAQQLLSSMGESENEEDESMFPIVVLDEAAQTTEPALMCALAAAKARQVIFIGDTKQLPPTVSTQDGELRKTLGVSPMERLLKNGIDEFILHEQYRMPQSLLYHPNKYFYNGVVKCATNGGADQNLHPPNGFPWPSPNDEPLAFLEIGNDSEVAHNMGGRSNPTEVEVIVDIIGKVIAAGDISAKSIAIITPYSKQVQLFRTELINANLSGVQVGTVDSFQGQETDLVIFSAVRSNRLKELGFLRDERRLNVAITRAKRGLIVVGDPTVLRTCRHWAALLENCSDRGCVLTQKEYNSNNKEVMVATEPPPNDERRGLSDLEACFRSLEHRDTNTAS